MPRSQDLAIFVLTIDDRQADIQTDCFTPATHARSGVINDFSLLTLGAHAPKGLR
jgi:hypothetical protein